ncbi:MAG: DUF2065 domain-containing protein [Desulfobacteraceae bacterium]|nr:DUF2065 domain-containing protein [Desulfobacteraceae bacterium]
MKLLVSLFGLVLVLEGLPYAVFPEAMRAWLVQMAALPARLMRVVGALALAGGLILCYLAQRTALFG